MEGWTVKDDDSKKRFIAHIEELYAKHKRIEIQYTTAKPRTLAQNNALHMWLAHVAKRLNEAGLDMKKTLKPEVEIPWTMQSAKDHLWRPVQRIMTGEESTKEPERAEYTKVYETISRHLAQTHGITIPGWPTKNG
jgi:3-phenylpropionate/cinnamic acid dioxygenase small subunit